jgi:hypothetical protein
MLAWKLPQQYCTHGTHSSTYTDALKTFIINAMSLKELVQLNYKSNICHELREKDKLVEGNISYIMSSLATNL